MTILFNDGRDFQRIEATAQAPDVLIACARFMLLPADFDIVLIDLSTDIESCDFFDSDSKRRVCSMGGASARAVYEAMAQMFPQINCYARPAAR